MDPGRLWDASGRPLDGRSCPGSARPLAGLDALGPRHQTLQRYISLRQHDDVIKWKHFQRYWPFVRLIYRPPVNSPHKGQWRGALNFSLICAWINGWVNNREAGDLRRHRAHYDAIVMHTELTLLHDISPVLIHQQPWQLHAPSKLIIKKKPGKNQPAYKQNWRTFEKYMKLFRRLCTSFK